MHGLYIFFLILYSFSFDLMIKRFDLADGLFTFSMGKPGATISISFLCAYLSLAKLGCSRITTKHHDSFF